MTVSPTGSGVVYAHDNLRPPTEKYFPPETTATCFSVNQSVVLTATPNSGYKFSKWVITGATTYTGTLNPYTIKMPTDDTKSTRVTAYFSGNTTPVPPVANAGADQTVKENVKVTLDGSKSTDADGTIVSYQWTQTSGTQVALSSATTSKPTFTTPYIKGGDTLVFQLTVTDNDGNKGTDSVKIIVQWTDTSTLTADAGDTQSVFAGDTVTLDGSGSSDTGGRITDYFWEVSRAYQSIDTSGILSNPYGVTTSFIAPDAKGWIEFKLTVTNSDGKEDWDLVMININNGSGPTELTADAGHDQVVATGSMVQLTGSWISPDSAIPTYQWKQISGPSITLSGSDGMAPGATRDQNPTFTAPALSSDQEEVELQFIVKDAKGVTSTDNVVVTVDSLDYILNSRPPVADAGSDQAVAPGEKVTLDGSNSSDPEGNLFSYQWTVTSSTETIVLSDPFVAKPTFVAPPSPSGSATFELVVMDDATKTDTATVEVAWSNAPPTANANADQLTVDEGVLVTLDASGSSDPDDGIASYHWAQLDGPVVTLSDSSEAQPTFSAPSINTDSATLTFELTVTDNGGLSGKAQVEITVENVNGAPVADAGDDQMVTEKAEVTLNGSGSTDPDGDTLSYQWIQDSGPTVTLSDDSSANPTFTAPSVTSEVILTFSLTVGDGEVTSSDDISVTVYPSSVLPVADAGPDQEVDEGTPVTLDASGSSDADEGIKSYLWEQQDGIGVVLSDASAIMPSFEAPKISEKKVVLTFKLTVENYNGVKNTDSVSITVDNKSSHDGGGCFISTVGD